MTAGIMRTLRCAFTVFSISMVGCGAPQTSDPLLAVNATLRELGVPPSAAGEFTRDSLWRVFVETTSATPHLVLILKLPDIVLPDGAFELLAPLTYFQYERESWQQRTQLKGGTVIAAPADSVLALEFSDSARTYFYRVRTIALDTGVPSAGTLDQIRLTVQDMLRQAAVLRREGFIGADAEP